MPADWKTYRTAVRTTVNAKETAIAALADIAAVKLYENHPVTYTRKTVTYDGDGNPVYGSPNITSDTTYKQSILDRTRWSCRFLADCSRSYC